MTKLMQQIEDAMAKVDLKQVLQDLAKVKPATNEKVVGTASEELLRLWGLVVQIDQELEEFSRRALLALADTKPFETYAEAFEGKCKLLNAESDEIENRRMIVDRLFWASVKADFPETLATSVGIRADGQIVTFKDSSRVAIINVSDLLGSDPSRLKDLLGMRRR